VVIVIANEKGGTGKTTTAITFAALLAGQGRPVTVLDTDTDREGRRGQSSALRRGKRALAGYEQVAVVALDRLESLPVFRRLPGEVIVDTPPASAADAVVKEAMRIADLVVIPCGDARDEMETTVGFIRDAVVPTGAQYRVVLTRIDPRSTHIAAQVLAHLRRQGIPVFRTVIRQYVAYRDSDWAGDTVADHPSAAAQAAAEDYRALLSEVQSHAR
jgi:chromosome partitioning protein